jgi:gamma-D-glutamyl-L-lysine dipeptidyl-peptidase
MRRVAIAVLLVASACAHTSPAASPPETTSTSTTPPPTATPSASPRGDVVRSRWVDVSVATVWTLPTSARTIDAPALAAPADPRGWLAHMSDAQKLDLVGRVQTQVLYGERVIVTDTNGSWSHVVIPNQRSQKDARGYPGWIPTAQLTSTTTPGPHVLAEISVPTLKVADLDLSYGTILTVVRRDARDAEVQLFDGRRATVPSSALTRASDVIVEAKKFLGLPYMWGGTSGFGFDCSGFTMLVYRSVGISLARDTDQQVHDGKAVPLGEIRPGDLLFVADSSGAVIHEAIFIGDGRIIESPRTGLPVRIVPLSTHTYVGARRVLPG